MLRLFIGIPLPDRYQKRLQALVEELGASLHSKVRWTRSGNGHLTLKFLGTVDEDRLGDIAATLSLIDFPAFDIRFGACACYPDTKRPRVVWMAVHKGARPCEKLAAIMERETSALGFKSNSHPFKPHLTLGRIKKPVADNWEAVLRAVDTRTWPGFRVDRFVLWSSDLTHDGPVYTPLNTFVLSD